MVEHIILKINKQKVMNKQKKNGMEIEQRFIYPQLNEVSSLLNSIDLTKRKISEFQMRVVTTENPSEDWVNEVNENIEYMVFKVEGMKLKVCNLISQTF